MNSNINGHQENKKIFNWKDTSLLIWALPILGYLVSICVDVGYLSYFQIPASFAEVNSYTVGLGSLVLIVFAILFFGLIALAVWSQNRESDFLPSLVDTNCVVLVIFTYILFRSEQVPLYYLLHIYVTLNFIKKTYLLFDTSKVDYSVRLRSNWFDSSTTPVPVTSDSISSEYFPYLIAALMFAFGMSQLMMATGRLAASTGFLELKSKGQSNLDSSTILLPRNNSRYILITYDRKTGILNPEFQIQTLSDKPLKLMPVDKPPLLMSKSAYEKKQKNDKQALKTAQEWIYGIRGY